LLGLRLLANPASPWNGAAAGLVFTLAFLTKQTSLAVIAAMLPYAFLKGFGAGTLPGDATERKASLASFLAVAAAGIAGSSLILNAASGGWFAYYIFTVPGSHASIAGSWSGFWTRDMLGHFPLPLGMAAFALYRAYRSGGWRSDTLWFRACGTLGMLGNAWISRTHEGSWDNVLLPGFIWLALMAGWGLAETLPWRGWRGTLLGLLFLAQCAALGYKPWTQIPDAADRAEGDGIVARIAAIPGDVWVPDHEYLAEWAGKKSYGNRMPLEDLWRGKGGEPKRRLEDSLASLFRNKRLGALLLDMPALRDAGILPPAAEKWYALGETLPLRGRAFYPKTGVKSRPLYLFFPRP
jgi:hypothetical protein